jgi:hypothetical protein
VHCIALLLLTALLLDRASGSAKLVGRRYDIQRTADILIGTNSQHSRKNSWSHYCVISTPESKSSF